MRHRGTKFWIECGLAAVSGSLFILTLITREWIEVIFRIDPDQGSGALEWAIVATSLVLTLVFTLLARGEHKRLLARSREDVSQVSMSRP